MTFSLDETWRDAARLLRTNGSMLLPLGGVFFLLPLIVYSLAVPVFVAPQSQDQLVLAQALAEYLPKIVLPTMLLGAVFVLGSGAIYHLLLDPARPTVGRAIAAGARSWPSLMLLLIILSVVQLLLLVTISLVAGLLGLEPGGASLLFIGFLLVAAYVSARFVPAGPAIAAERLRNPVAFVRRSLGLTKGKGMRIALFLFVFGVASLILVYAVQIVVGSVLVLLGGDAGRQIAGVLGSVLSSAALVVLTVIYASIYRRLSSSGASVSEADSNTGI